MSKEIVWAWIDRDMKRFVKEIAEAHGISLSEYVRSLIIQDLEKRGFITVKIEKLKEEIRNECRRF